MSTEKQGTIRSVVATPGSGMMTVVVEREDGSTETLHGDSGPTGRALVQAFGRGILAGGMTLNVAALVGRQIAYDVDEVGVLAYIRNPDDEDC